MLRRLTLRDVAIVAELELELHAGFTVLTGETGAGKSILIDALQLALGGRGDATWVREGATRAEVSAEFDTPTTLKAWLQDAGFDGGDGSDDGSDDGSSSDGSSKLGRASDGPAALLLRRSVDTQGRSRAWVNGAPATLAQLRELGEHLVDIHGQHAWQSLTRPDAVRAVLDNQAGIDPQALNTAWHTWRDAGKRLDAARAQHDNLQRERERLAWQLAEMERLAPGEQEWAELNVEHQRLANAQALMDAAATAQAAVAEADTHALGLVDSAVRALDAVASFDPALGDVAEVLRTAQVQLSDAAHSLSSYLHRSDLQPDRLAELDARLAAWVALARRFRHAPAELPRVWQAWTSELASLDAAADLAQLQAATAAAEAAWRTEARQVSRERARAAPVLAKAVTQGMQQLGMAGGRFEVALLPQAEPHSQGLETVELRVAGHAGSTPRPLAKVASGGELSRLALAIAVSCAPVSSPHVSSAPVHGASTGQAAPRSTKARAKTAAASSTQAALSTLIFDEIDAGVGGAVADSVGRLMKALGSSAQVLAVTHLAQVAACADHHCVVSKGPVAASGTGKKPGAGAAATHSRIQAVQGEARVAEVARMLGGERLSGVAHAQALLKAAAHIEP